MPNDYLYHNKIRLARSSIKLIFMVVIPCVDIIFIRLEGLDTRSLNLNIPFIGYNIIIFPQAYTEEYHF